MPLDLRAKRLLDMLALAKPKIDTAEERRTSFVSLMQMAAKPGPDIPVFDARVPDSGMPVRLYGPAEKPGPTLLFFHGGGLVAGSIDTHDGICRRLAAASGVTVVSAGYRCAPEARFPAQLDDAAAALLWLAARPETDRARIAVGGDSVGALLAMLLAAGFRQTGVPIAAQLLLCPVVDLAFDGGSRRELAEGFLIDARTIARDVADCLGQGGTAWDLPSPLRMSWRSRVRTIIHSAEYDPFRDEAALLTQQLETLGFPVWQTCHAGLVHSFYGLPAFIPQAEEALRQAGRELADALN